MKKNVESKIQNLNEEQCELVFGGIAELSEQNDMIHRVLTAREKYVRMAPIRPKPRVTTF